MLSSIFESKKQEITVKLRQNLEKNLHNSHYLTNIIKLIKSRKNKYVGCAASIVINSYIVLKSEQDIA